MNNGFPITQESIENLYKKLKSRTYDAGIPPYPNPGDYFKILADEDDEVYRLQA